MKYSKKTKKVDRNIWVDEEKGKYYVSMDLAHFVSFPTKEDAIAYRDEIQAERLKNKIAREKLAIREREKKELEKAFHETYPMNLIEASEIQDRMEYLDEALAKLDPKKREVVRKYYEEKMTLAEIGKDLRVTRERIRQIICKSLIKINAETKYAEKRKAMEEIHASKEGDAENLNEWRAKVFAEYAKSHEYGPEMVATFGPIQVKSEAIEDVDIADLDLSIRTYNCLKRAGYETLSDIASKTEDEVMRIRNLGKRSYKELSAKLEEYGIRLK